MKETYVIAPIGFVKSSRKEAYDDNWNTERFEIELAKEFDESSLEGLERLLGF